MAISSPGIGSGLDVNTIITRLMQVERQPLQNVQARETQVKSRISALGQITSSINALRDAARAVGQADFSAVRVGSSNAAVATATGTSAAAGVSVSLNVTQLAAAQRSVSAAQAGGSSTVIGEGTLTLSSGATTESITIGAGNSSLTGIRDAINSGSTLVRASIVNDAAGSRLVLTGVQTGASNAFSISASDGDGDPATGLSGLAAGISTAQTAQNATATADGISVSSSTNTFAGVVDGLTITALSTGVTNLTASTDSGAAKTALGNLATAFNNFKSLADRLGLSVPGEGADGPLSGDGTLRQVTSRIRSEFSRAAAGVTTEFTSFASIGLTFQRDGTMAFDGARFDRAMASDSTGVIASVRNTLAPGLTNALDSLTRTDGLVTARVNGLNSTVKTLQNQQESLTRRLEDIESRYRRQFAALDSMLGSMNSTSQYLAQQLGSLGAQG